MFNPSQHARVMRATPKDLAAVYAAAEFVLCLARVRGEQIRDRAFFYGGQDAVAFHATSERIHEFVQSETLHYFTKLIVRFIGADAAAVRDLAPLQKTDIACEQNAILVAAHSGELRIVRQAFIPRIKAEHAQISRKPAQVSIDDEFRAPRMRSEADAGRFLLRHLR